MIAPLPDLSRMGIHTFTTRPWTLSQCLDEYALAGVRHITVWRNVIEGPGLMKAARMVRESGLKPTALCRAGLFPAQSQIGRRTAIDDTRRAIHEAAEIGAPLVVIVPGAVPRMDLADQRAMVRDGIEAVLAEAEAADVRLGLEPLHPMYADSRSVISTVAQALELVESIDSPQLGLVVDVFHTWWDHRLEDDLRRARGRLFAFHVNDWLSPMEDMLMDRGLMGEGCIPIRRIRSWMDAAGFDGPIEVEIFSNRLWARDQREYLEAIKRAYLAHV